MSITEIVNGVFHDMSKSEQAVAAYFTDHIQDFTLYTLDSIADNVGVSTTSVIRFCRKLGFTGYKDFQNHLRAEVNIHLTLPEKLKRLDNLQESGGLVQQILQDGVENIEKTFAEMPPHALEGAAKLIHEAKRVFTFGMRESMALAHYAYTRFTTVRRNTQVLDVGYNGMVEQALDLTDQDTVVCFLFHRYTSQSLKVLPLIKAQGAKVILITSAPYDRLEKYADILLPCHVKTRGVKNSSLAPMCIADYFCNAVALLNKEDTDARMAKTEEVLRSERVLGS